jgi:mycothiol synthase
VIHYLEHLDSQQQISVLALISDATDHDGIPPIAEHVILHLRHGGDKEDRHIIVENDHEIVGYAHLDLTDIVAGPSAELVIHPDHRGQGLGRLLLEEICRITSPRLWSHGDLPNARKLAEENGLERVRTVIQMRRPLTEHLPGVASTTTMRSFLPGLDDEDWLDVNNRVFRNHPEQGQWTLSNLHDRMKETWFDARGFLLATQRDQITAFCWTKIHGGLSYSHDENSTHDHDPIGEVYAMGVDPDFQGQGLGRAITVAGLAHLRRQGLMSAMLYVDAENAEAIKLYKDLGFTEWGRDVMYRLASVPPK